MGAAVVMHDRSVPSEWSLVTGASTQCEQNSLQGVGIGNFEISKEKEEVEG